MNRQELQELSKVRRREAAALIKSKHYSGAYYLLGYSVECALKACIAKQTQKFDFPNKELANKAHVHNLEQLVKLAGLETDLNNKIAANKIFEVNWAVVKDWKETSRYICTIVQSDAKDLYTACTSRSNGILSWIQSKW